MADDIDWSAIQKAQDGQSPTKPLRGPINESHRYFEHSAIHDPRFRGDGKGPKEKP